MADDTPSQVYAHSVPDYNAYLAAHTKYVFLEKVYRRSVHNLSAPIFKYDTPT